MKAKKLTPENITDEDIDYINLAEYQLFKNRVINKFNMKNMLTVGSPNLSKIHMYNFYVENKIVGTFSFVVRHGSKKEPKLIHLTSFYAENKNQLIIEMENTLKEIYKEFQVNIPIKEFLLDFNSVFKEHEYIPYKDYIEELILSGFSLADLNKKGLFKENLFKNFK